PGGAHPRASCARGTPFLSNMPTLTHASVLLTLLASSLCAQRGRATLQHAGLESSIDHGQPLWGKHTLESLPVGQQWRLGNESATCWRTAVPLIQGDVLIAPGAYRVALSRRGEQSFTVDFASAAMAFGGNGTPGFAAKLVPGKHEVEKRLTLELRRTDGKGQNKNAGAAELPALLQIRFGPHRADAEFTVPGARELLASSRF